MAIHGNTSKSGIALKCLLKRGTSELAVKCREGKSIEDILNGHTRRLLKENLGTRWTPLPRCEKM
ncbi:hypothetical protein N7491_001111 [Penicillium cf. griseofulvum]|nr:hypothetical protein N7491_001111 [Penicillium cf. griseofulvum]KAJ5446746.1 hypothetical protein N7445_001567 [Penicillium cf. griseofulvum]